MHRGKIIFILIIIISFSLKSINGLCSSREETSRDPYLTILIYPRNDQKPVNALLVDPQNRSLGIDPETNTEVRQIPNGDYYPQKRPEGGRVIEIEIPALTIGGVYRLKIWGESEAEYQVDFHGLNSPRITSFGKSVKNFSLKKGSKDRVKNKIIMNEFLLDYEVK